MERTALVDGVRIFDEKGSATIRRPRAHVEYIRAEGLRLRSGGRSRRDSGSSRPHPSRVRANCHFRRSLRSRRVHQRGEDGSHQVGARPSLADYFVPHPDALATRRHGSHGREPRYRRVDSSSPASQSVRDSAARRDCAQIADCAAVWRRRLTRSASAWGFACRSGGKRRISAMMVGRRAPDVARQ